MNTAQGDGDEVLIGLSAEATMSFGLPVVTDDSSGMLVPLRLSAYGLSIRTRIELERWAQGPERLVGFIDDMATSWRGWVGAKEWSDDGPAVSISATHDRMAVISFVISVAPFFGSERPGSWKAQVVVPVEPGSLAPLAENLRSLIERAGWAWNPS